MLLSDDSGSPRTRGLLTGGDGPNNGGYGGTSVQRSLSLYFAVPAALASKRFSRQSNQPSEPETSEKGFYRVSGRKLPSVFVNGGDGYTDPRESVVSGTSTYYRGSQAFEPPQDSPRLALGSPMRPISGIPVMRSGPARTPVTEENPFADPPLTPPATDPIGRSLTSQDGSRGSGSRFTERV
jgi:hypothetical protein